jgi:hypothetical protein
MADTTAQSANIVRPRSTVEGGPYLRSKKATHIRIGVRPHDYPTSAVMSSWRGDPIQPSLAKPIGSFNATPVESGKKASSAGMPPTQ